MAWHLEKYEPEVKKMIDAIVSCCIPLVNTLKTEKEELEKQIRLLQGENSDLQKKLDVAHQEIIAKTEETASFYRNANDTLKKDLDYVREEYDQLKTQNDIVMNVFQCLYGVKVRGDLSENALVIVDRAAQELEDKGYIVSVDYETRAGCFKSSIGISNTETILIKPAIIKPAIIKDENEKIIAHGAVVIPKGNMDDQANEEQEKTELTDNSNKNSTKKLFE